VLSRQSTRLRTKHVTGAGMLHEEAAPPKHSNHYIAHKSAFQAITTDFEIKLSNLIQVRRQMERVLIR
jgi:hypothetical protein